MYLFRAVERRILGRVEVYAVAFTGKIGFEATA